MCHRHAHSRLRVRKQLCHSTVTLEARSSSFMADGREAERSALVISNAQLQYLFFFFFKKKHTHIALSFCPHPSLYCSLHSSPQWAAHGAEVNADVSLCLQSKVAVQRNFIFYESNKSPLRKPPPSCLALSPICPTHRTI